MGKDTAAIGRAGEHLVAAEINLMGGYAITFAGNMPGIDVMARNKDGSRTVTIQVKTKSQDGFAWHARSSFGEAMEPRASEDTFWVLVCLEGPDFYVVPESWLKNDIYEKHQAYLAKHGGTRKVNPKSDHHGISTRRVERWRDRWDVLGILDEGPATE